MLNKIEQGKKGPKQIA